MKIAWLHSHFNNWMGSHSYILEIIKRLAKDNQLTIFTSQANFEALKKFKSIDVEVKKIGATSTYDFKYWLFLPFYLNKEIKNLKKEIKNFDLLISSYFPANVWIKDFNTKKVQILFEPLGLFHDKTLIDGLPIEKSIALKIFKNLYQKLDIEATKKSDVIFTLSKETKKEIKEIYQKDSIITYEGVDINFFKPIKNEQIEKKYLNQKIIIHCTDFTPIKGTAYLVKALPAVVSEIKNCRLLITTTIDNQKEKQKLINQAKNLKVLPHIEFLGYVDYQLLPAYLTRANILIHCGIGSSAGATSMSMPVKQALACGTPVIRSPEGETEVKNGYNGFLVNPLETKLLSRKIIYCLLNPTLSSKMGINGRNHVIKYFTWEKVFTIIKNKISKFYDSSN